MEKSDLLRLFRHNFNIEDAAREERAANHAKKVGSKMMEHSAKQVDAMLESLLNNIDQLPIDILVLSANTALPMKTKLNNWVNFVNALATEMQARGYNYKEKLKHLL